MGTTLWIDRNGVPQTWDQTRLPFERIAIPLADELACAQAIRSMQVRGAPLIGAVAAFGLAHAIRDGAQDDAALAQALSRLAQTRPTAVNLRWALERVRDKLSGLPPALRAQAAREEAQCIAEEDALCNQRIGEHARALLEPLRRADRPLQLMTHCNAGRLATLDHGTALAPCYALHQAGVPVHVWVSETRPRNQGASLSAWELADRGVPHTVIADNAAGQLMRERRVDAVIVGCDRVAMNGDVANKIGTYLKALAARDNGVPFLVACPISSIDPRAADGAAIPIELRDPDEVRWISGRGADGSLRAVQLVPDASPALNPAFDVTPARLVDALITERGVCQASARALRELLGARQA